MSISEAISKIKTAIYGEEVRGSIVEALEACYDDMNDNLPGACEEAISRHQEWATTVPAAVPKMYEIEIPADGWNLGDYECGEKYACSAVHVPFDPISNPRIVVVGVKGGTDAKADADAYKDMGNIRISGSATAEVVVYASWKPSKAITLLALVSGQQGDGEVCTGGAPDIFLTSNDIDNATLAANTASNVKVIFPKVDGYERVCVATRITQATSDSANHYNCYSYGAAFQSDSQLYVYVKNTASSAAKVRVYATVLYVKSARMIPYASL